MSIAARLKESIEQVVGAPVDVDIGRFGEAGTVTVTPSSPEALAVVAAFDWSQAAQDAWLEDKHPERKSLRQAAANAIADNEAFIADSNVTQAEAVAQVKRLSQQMNRVIRRLVQLS